VVASDPAVVIAGPARLDVFARGGNNALWHRAHNGVVWSAWESLGGALVSGPGAVSWQPGRMDVFSSQVGGLLGRRSWQGAWLP
jgi:hypothetical protein